MRPSDDPVHDLLPFYLNGTLEAAEADRFGRHLSSCDACREEADVLRGLGEEVERHGEAFFEPHPAASIIVDAALGRLPAAEGKAVRRHLDLCSTCDAEVRLVRGEGGSRRLRAVLPWAIAASALVAGGLSLTLRPAPVRVTRIVQPNYVEQRVRAGGVTVVEVPDGETSFEIVLPLDVAPSSYPVALEIRDARGAVVFGRAGLRGAYRDRFLFVECLRSDFPDGDYVARATPSAGTAAAPPAPVEFAFRVARAGARR